MRLLPLFDSKTMKVSIEITGVLDGLGKRHTSTGSCEPIPLHELPLIAYYSEQLAHFEVEREHSMRGMQPSEISLREIADQARAMLDYDWYAACDYLNIPLRDWNLTSDFDSIPGELIAQLTNGKAHLGMILTLEDVEYVLVSATLKDGSLCRPESDGQHYILSVAEACYFVTDSKERMELLKILALLNGN